MVKKPSPLKHIVPLMIWRPLVESRTGMRQGRLMKPSRGPQNCVSTTQKALVQISGVLTLVRPIRMENRPKTLRTIVTKETLARQIKSPSTPYRRSPTIQWVTSPRRQIWCPSPHCQSLCVLTRLYGWTKRPRRLIPLVTLPLAKK